MDVFLVLGAALVKSALKIWLRDEAFAAGAGSSVVDLVQAQISGDLERRQLRRFFEDLEVPVAKRLRALREVEFGSMPENEWKATVLAAGESFDRAQLTAKDLFTGDLDPLFLEQHIRSGDPRATRDLSADGMALYDRLLSEGCAQVIEIADKLPHFQIGAFAELLRRDRQIVELISEVLDRIPAKVVGNSQESLFVTSYLRRVATRLDRLELFGLDFKSPWYPLSVAYISLSTDDEVSGNGQSIEDRLAATPRALLVGRAGSGKTTVLQWLAVRAARSDFRGVLADLNGYVPFLVRLREYVGREMPQPEDFIMGVAPLLAPEMTEGWVRAQLRSGRALLLVDGVDELPPSQRNSVAVWLHELSELFGNLRCVVTTRPVEGISDNWLHDFGYVRTSLEAMSPSLVETFIRHWHEATRQQLADADERERLDNYEHSLLTTIADDRNLADLADTPLLAGLLCALNCHLRSQLPRRRSDIYERALAMFDQRDQARHIMANEIRLDLADKSYLLGDLALWMMRNGESEVDVESATAQLGRSLPALKSATYHSIDILRVLLERSGLLREPAVGRVDFVHRTFQEYLAAKAAVHGDAIGELVEKTGDDQWAEVVVLAAGQANQPQSRRLMQLLVHQDPDQQQRTRRHLLAVACLREIRSLEPELRMAVEAIIPELLPPKTMDTAKQLSTVGETLIPLLAQYWTKDRTKAAHTIRAASLVGGSAALNLIRNITVEFGRRPSQKVHSELLRAWQYFDPEEYARQVLTCGAFRSFTIRDGHHLYALQNVPSTRRITLEMPLRELDAELLQALTGLEQLAVVFDTSMMIEMMYNEDVDGSDVDSSEIGYGYTYFIESKRFRQVRSVIYDAIPEELRALSKLSRLPRLRDLSLLNYPGSNLSDLPATGSLKTLAIDSGANLISLSGIERQQELEALTLAGCALQGIDELAALPQLYWLHLYDCGTVDLAPLAPRRLRIIANRGTSLLNVSQLAEGSEVTGSALRPGERATGIPLW